MKLKESLVLDGLIADRRQSLSKDGLSEKEINQRELSLVVLIEARNKLNSITKKPAKFNNRTTIGDINITCDKH